jgi:hypothetical protein
VILINASNRKRWLLLILIYGIVPLVIYWTLIGPPMLRISSYQDRIRLLKSSTSQVRVSPAPATSLEMEQLEEIKQVQLARIKKAGNRQALLQFSGLLADALAAHARSYGLRVTGVDMESLLIKGKYVPANDRALQMLADLPGLEWNELQDPLDVPLLNLPSIELQMTVSGEYSRVFSFIEALPDFPVQVLLTGLNVVDDPGEQTFRLIFHGYYCDIQKKSSASEQAKDMAAG